MNTRVARTARATVTATFATFIAAFSHLVGGAQFPAPAALALSLAFSLLACLALSRRAFSSWRTGASVATSQLMFHGLFSFLGAPGQVVHGGHHASFLVVPATQDPVAHSPLMWLSHLGAAIVTFAALRHGERLLRGLGDVASILVARLFAMPRLPDSSAESQPNRAGGFSPPTRSPSSAYRCTTGDRRFCRTESEHRRTPLRHHKPCTRPRAARLP